MDRANAVRRPSSWRSGSALAFGCLVVAIGAAGCGGDDAEPAVSPPVSGTMPTVSIQTTTVRTNTVPGDIDAGRTVFEQSCQGCHLSGGTEAGAGPKLAEFGLTPDQIQNQILRPRSAMPPNLVSGTDLVNVTAYVASIQ